MKIYAAYGSNMDLGQMARRCPGANVIGKGAVRGHRLLFRGSKTGSYATIEPCEGAETPVLLWEIDEFDEASLDRYEGFPTFYQKEAVAVDTAKGTVEAMAYVMDPSRPLGAPTDWYYGVLADAYGLFGFDRSILRRALADSIG